MRTEVKSSFLKGSGTWKHYIASSLTQWLRCMVGLVQRSHQAEQLHPSDAVLWGYHGLQRHGAAQSEWGWPSHSASWTIVEWCCCIVEETQLSAHLSISAPCISFLTVHDFSLPDIRCLSSIGSSCRQRKGHLQRWMSTLAVYLEKDLTSLRSWLWDT